jgi:ribosomal protein S12 methylthiotransferase accessory factor
MVPRGQRPQRWMPFAMGSNGLAGGNHMLEALCSALYEVIERDAVACNRVAMSTGYQSPRVRLETIESPLVLDLIERLDAAGIGTILIDCTVDTGVPCFMAIIHDLLVPQTGMHRGYGAHLDPAIAMVRALTEAVQSRVITIAGSRDDLFRRDRSVNRLAGGDAGIAAFAALTATVEARGLPSQALDSFGGDCNLLIEKLRRVGLEQVIVFDLSHEGVDVPVVRVVVPGLEGYMFDHYTPGRRARAFAAAHAPVQPAGD